MAQQQKSPEQKLLEAQAAIRAAVTNVETQFRELHPQSGCLPLPEFRRPETAADMDAYADELLSNMYEGEDFRLRSTAWVDSREHCPHLDEESVRAAFEVIGALRGVVIWAAAWAGMGKDYFTIAQRAESLTMRSAEFASRALAAISVREAGNHG